MTRVFIIFLYVCTLNCIKFDKNTLSNFQNKNSKVNTFDMVIKTTTALKKSIKYFFSMNICWQNKKK